MMKIFTNCMTIVFILIIFSACGSESQTETPADINQTKDTTQVAQSKIVRINLAKVAQDQGKTPLEYLEDEFDKKHPSAFVLEDQMIFNPWSDAVPSSIRFSTDNWASQFDFTGIAWNSIKAGALVTNQHIIVVAHFARGVGQKVYFYTKDGVKIVRTVVALKYLSKYDSTIIDGCIEKLDAPLPDTIKVYPLIDPSGLGDFSSLEDAPSVYSDQRRKLFAGKITHLDTPKTMMWLWKNPKVDEIMFHNSVGGDSGSPMFFIIDGKLVFVSALTGHATSTAIQGHFYGYKSVYDALLLAIEDMKDIH
ncbi:hypothetical protein MNB_SM-4-1782 [hydrothermal vent metagenome]|uniref:Peptidase S1 domain-containing protein n=1 Tax=hydrothermal vent metagenome TaxID=652676 RepID=A0A1W1C9M6_9ZZZZ